MSVAVAAATAATTPALASSPLAFGAFGVRVAVGAASPFATSALSSSPPPARRAGRRRRARRGRLAPHQTVPVASLPLPGALEHTPVRQRLDLEDVILVHGDDGAQLIWFLLLPPAAVEQTTAQAAA